jgi:hypothetical protein
MKTIFRVLAVSAGVFGVAWYLGSNQDEAKADTPDVAATRDLQVAAAPPAAAPAENTPPVLQRAEPVIVGGGTNASLAATNSAAFTNAEALKLSTNLITAPTLPDSVKLSTPLSDIIKLVHAGVSEPVLLAFIASANEPFDAGSAEIIYLHDIGLGPNVITALLQHDSTPEMQARKQATNAVKPLPPGVALTTPATNIYTPKETFAAPANPPEPQPVNPPSDTADSAAAPTPAQPVSMEPEAYDGSPAVTSVSYNYWYSSLAPYGSWVNVGSYGPCWRPTVAVCNSGWRPYGNGGRWLWTDAGWYWYSDYSWGWGPFHYGRWFYPPGIGWVWAPGNCWGPAWVSWRYTPSYCGWAPLPPAACYAPRSGFYFNTASVGIGCEFGLSASAYVFLPLNRFCDRRPYNYYVAGGHSQTIYKDSTVINNYVVGNNNTIINRGIGVERVSQVTRGNIRQVALRDTTTLRNVGPRHEQLAGDGATLAVHRPDSTLITRRGAVAPAPSPTSAMSVFRPRNERTASANASAVSADATHNIGHGPPRVDQARLTSPGASPSTSGTDATSRRPGSIFLTRPTASTPVNTGPVGAASDREVPSRPRNGSGSTFTGNSVNSTASGNATKPTTPSIIMRNPNPNRSGVNRPVTYPFVPSTAQARADAASTTPSRPSFTPGPPANRQRPSYSAPAANIPRPQTYSARASSAPAAAPAPPVSRPSVSAPARSNSGGGSSSGSSSRSSSSSSSAGRSSGVSLGSAARR